jgi:hypothetical protein
MDAGRFNAKASVFLCDPKSRSLEGVENQSDQSREVVENLVADRLFFGCHTAPRSWANLAAVASFGKTARLRKT